MNDQPPPMATPRMAAGAVFTDAHGRVLLVEPTYKTSWDVPGGYVEPGESPRAACLREVREELGIDTALGGLLVIDWAPSDEEGDKLLFLFTGGSLTRDQQAGIRLPRDELVSYAFVSAADFDDRLAPRLARRVRLALDALTHGHPIYAEHGADAQQPSS